jgi:NAD(P)-dependent dehydrogenase (short-subunit alcohol dehydrogenase family)
MALPNGKVALITCTAGRPGRVANAVFAREWARVIGCDIRSDKNTETVRAVRAAGGEITGFAPVDLTDPAQVEGFVNKAAVVYDGIDTVYNFAGAAGFGSVPEMPGGDWRATAAIELDSSWFVTRYASRSARRCRDQRGVLGE